MMPHQINTLYVDHYGWLKGWLRHKLGDSFTAADLAHDTFVRLLAREEAVVIQEPRAFLTTVAQRVLANHWRRQQLERAYLDALAHLPATSTPSEEARAILFETLMQIDRMLDGLPVPVKRVFLLTHLDGLNHVQVAGTMNISLSTVKRHLIQAARQCYFPDALPA
jgi:RNA polymerase sigma factor (sigma-70 family)